MGGLRVEILVADSSVEAPVADVEIGPLRFVRTAIGLHGLPGKIAIGQSGASIAAIATLMPRLRTSSRS
jgi:hypothetical protein